MPLPYVGKRQVIHIGGFDPIDTDRLNHRLVSGLEKLSLLWGFNVAAEEPELSTDGRIMSWRVQASGPNWRTETNYAVLLWDDLIGIYSGKPAWQKLLLGFSAIFHFILNGTIYRYFRANGRYGLFVLYPIFLTIGLAAIAVTIGRVIAGLDLPIAEFLGFIVGLGVFGALLTWAGSYFHLYFALADWAFAADLVRGQVPGLEACLDQFAAEVVRRVREGECDEVVLSGVSFGAVMMAETLARSLRSDPALGRRGTQIVFLTVGSSILKIGLHPGVVGLKNAVGKLSVEPSLLWIEYQSKVDPINFFKTDPVALMGLPPTGKPIVKTMRIRETMMPEEYRRLRTNFLRLHRQFTMPNSRRYFYDFFLICFGPMPLTERLALGERATVAIGDDGSYRQISPMSRNNAAQAATE